MGEASGDGARYRGDLGEIWGQPGGQREPLVLQLLQCDLGGEIGGEVGEVDHVRDAALEPGVDLARVRGGVRVRVRVRVGARARG